MSLEYTIKQSKNSVFADYYELTKPGITYFVLLSMAIGFVMGSAGPFAIETGVNTTSTNGGETLFSGTLPFSIDTLLFLKAFLGTWLLAAGTSAHNMFMERGLDGLMRRTSNRPFPAGRIQESHGMIFSSSLMVFGLIIMFGFVNFSAGVVSLATSLIYLGAYTPMKRVTAMNVFLGAIPGALPVVGGWAAATGTIVDYGMWMLFWVMFLWQVPHVIAIAWLNKDDYHHAGFQMLPKNDVKGWKAAIWVVVSLLTLFPNVWKIWVLHYGGWTWLVGAGILSAFYLIIGVRFAYYRDNSSARILMFTSFLYLPGIWLALFIDRLWIWLT